MHRVSMIIVPKTGYYRLDYILLSFYLKWNFFPESENVNNKNKTHRTQNGINSKN